MFDPRGPGLTNILKMFMGMHLPMLTTLTNDYPWDAIGGKMALINPCNLTMMMEKHPLWMFCVFLCDTSLDEKKMHIGSVRVKMDGLKRSHIKIYNII